MTTLPTTATAGDSQEAGTLAREMAAAFKGFVEQYKAGWGVTLAEAVAQAEAPAPRYEADVLKGPADQVSWHGLAHLARTDPEAAERRWQEVKAEALAALRSGHGAAKAMEGYGANVWARAQFLALRSELTEGWQPRNGIERQLIDTMAQAQTAYRYWLEALAQRCSTSSARKGDEGRWGPLTVEDEEALEQAAAMAERFNGIFLRTLKALRDLRRQAPGLVVQNAEQVNVGQQQVNVNAGKRQAPESATAIP